MSAHSPEPTTRLSSLSSSRNSTYLTPRAPRLELPRSEPSRKPEQHRITRSASMRTRGLNLNTVSPAHSRSVSVVSHPVSSASSCESPVLGHSRKPSDADERIPSMDQLASLDIDEQLRLLAFKEMSVVEIKDNIQLLTQSLERHEREIHQVREVIQRSLYRELNTNSDPRDEAIASTKRSRRRTLSTSKPNIQPPPPAVVARDKRNSKLWNSISKPLNLLHQFDAMLQTEFERSMDITPKKVQKPEQKNTLDTSSKDRQIEKSTSDTSKNETHIEKGTEMAPAKLSVGKPRANHKAASTRKDTADYDKENERNHHRTKPSDSSRFSDRSLFSDATHKSRPSEDSISSYGSVSPLRSKSSNARAIDPGSLGLDRKRDDVLSSVSSSIWTFVNDVTSNVLSSLSEEDQERMEQSPLYNLDNGSAVTVDKETEISFGDFDDVEDTKIDYSMYRA